MKDPQNFINTQHAVGKMESSRRMPRPATLLKSRRTGQHVLTNGVHSSVPLLLPATSQITIRKRCRVTENLTHALTRRDLCTVLPGPLSQKRKSCIAKKAAQPTAASHSLARCCCARRIVFRDSGFLSAGAAP